MVRLPTALTERFGENAAKQAQWRGFITKAKLTGVGNSLQAIINDLVSFLAPVAGAIEDETEFNRHWHAPGPWA